jgi:hypothetical protein
MRVLTIFIDMIRANRLSTFNENVKVDTPLDKAFKDLGGTVYINCFTPGPDTPRGISTYTTGVEPWNNGCTTRLKWPESFLKKELKTVYDLFLEEDYKLDMFSALSEKTVGFFPEHIASQDIFNTDNNLEKYLNTITLNNDHFLFLGLSDYHWAFDDFGYTKEGEKKSYNIVKSAWDIIFERFHKDEFDHIFIFSDHGFKFNYERKKYSKEFLLNDDRTNIIMLHREKEKTNLDKNKKLCSIADIYPTYQQILGLETTEGISLLSNKERKYILSEDHKTFIPSVNQNIELWSLTTSEYIYIRTLENAILIDRVSKKTDTLIQNHFDKILVEKSSFGKYFNVYEKVFKYIKNVKLDSSLHYSNGKIRVKKNQKYIMFSSLFELIINFKR